MNDHRAEAWALLRHLVRMQRAGLPWLESLHMWRDGCRGQRQKARSGQLIARVRAGQSLSLALAHEGWLSGAALALSQAGEASGTWAEQMGLWLEHAERQAKLLRQLRSALAYPALVLGLAMLVIAGVMAWVLPVFEGLYATLNTPLPWATQTLLMTRRLLADGFAPALGVGWVGMLGVVMARRQPRARLHLERWIWRLPLLGRWRQMHAESQWCALLAHLLGAGLDWHLALDLVGPASGSGVVREATREVQLALTKGQNLTQALGAVNPRWSHRCGRPVFSPTLTQWVRAGEAAGTLPDLLQRWGQLQADALTEEWTHGTRLLEPLLMGLLGLLMGWLVLALYMPVLQMGQMI